jgi:hypothetical protein
MSRVTVSDGRAINEPMKGALMQDLESDKEALKARIKKLNAQATALKMDLHDLAEDLPTGWERIPDVAQQAYEAHRALMSARRALDAAG